MVKLHNFITGSPLTSWGKATVWIVKKYVTLLFQQSVNKSTIEVRGKDLWPYIFFLAKSITNVDAKSSVLPT